MKCQSCGKEVDLPFRCSYCQSYFCIDHKLPENHECPYLPKEKFWYKKEKIAHPEERVSKAEMNALISKIEEQKPKRLAEHEIRKSSRVPMIIAFCIILMVTTTLVGYIGYNFGYYEASNVASNTGYNKGYDKGYIDGNLSGYNLGRSVGYDDSYQSGYDIGYVQGVSDGAGRGYDIRDPTYQEVLQFISSDQTDKNQYDEESYTCHDFTADFKNNAFEAGYRCGYVYLELREGAHAIVCFDTIDNDLIFIEPQDDDRVTLTVGQPYWDRQIYPPPDYDDTVVRFDIIW